MKSGLLDEVAHVNKDQDEKEHQWFFHRSQMDQDVDILVYRRVMVFTLCYDSYTWSPTQKHWIFK